MEPMPSDPGDPATTATGAVPVISTRSLTKHYGRVAALTDLTLDVRPGEIFGFLGPNGAGKSTTIRTLLGYLHATSGGATVLGMDIATQNVEIRRLTGYLPGGIAVYDSLSGSDALDYLADLQGRAPHRRAELCERLQLSDAVLKRRVRDYSRGMRQKIGVVQALQHDPELAILDEPTEGLDPLMQQSFYAILDDLRAEGRTVFFSSHVLSEVERVCDRVGIVRAGRLMAVHEVADLLRRRRRKVSITWRGSVPDLTDLPGLEDVRTDGGRVTATLAGEVAPFVRAIASPNLEDLTIEPASLEEAFLEYYAGGEPDGVEGLDR
ncbi:MAG TPA: ABC transporter ATP-binding protein [Candidatus Limnocylindria bacterium]|nr:ABC transporter ATP-binding protein [Candidatus Limnocylindria bacterium]